MWYKKLILLNETSISDRKYHCDCLWPKVLDCKSNTQVLKTPLDTDCIDDFINPERELDRYFEVKKGIEQKIIRLKTDIA